MCGIVGLFAKSEGIRGQLGLHLESMLVQMNDRGPDSAGVAFYRDPAAPGGCKLTLQHPDEAYPWDQLAADAAAEFGGDVRLERRANHAVAHIPAEAGAAELWTAVAHPEVRVMSAGQIIELYKEVGLPRLFADRFHLSDLDGSHALGHTRMATESRVTTDGSHPFSTGLDLCLVHNGSLSNHNRVRERLRREGIVFRTENDSEVAAGYLMWRLREGASLTEALEGCLADLDGFYTFAVGTADGFAVLRDPIACKPAVMAETDDWVAMASEYRAIAVLPGRRRRDHLGARAGHGVLMGTGAGVVAVVDLASTPLRELNQRLHDLSGAADPEREWRVINPSGAHAVACGLDAEVEVEIDGHVGYYCAGMNQQARVTVRGNAGVGLAENIMSGTVTVTGNASQAAGATARGGLIVIEGDASARCGISLKGGDIVVKGSIGHMSAFMAQTGRIVVLGDAGDALGDSIYEARIYVRGTVKSLGADCIEKELRPEHLAELAELLAAAGADARPEEFRRYGSARELYTFHVDNAGSY